MVGVAISRRLQWGHTKNCSGTSSIRTCILIDYWLVYSHVHVPYPQPWSQATRFVYVAINP